jgi:sugar/nucleoside kinase (ribokinase family)
MVDVRGPAARAGTATHGSARLRAGGTAVNAALAAASIGARVLVVGRIGRDADGRLVTEALEAAGVAFRLAVDETRRPAPSSSSATQSWPTPRRARRWHSTTSRCPSVPRRC